MSALTPLPLLRFRDQLGARGLSIELLADRIERGRSHLSQVLWGHRAGGDTWPRLRAVVTDEEWETLLQLEHCATWNKAQLAHGPTAEVWLMLSECAGTYGAPCGALLRFSPCCQRMAGRVSHGLCPTCYGKTLSEIDQLSARQVERDVTADSFAPLEISASTHENASSLGAG